MLATRTEKQAEQRAALVIQNVAAGHCPAAYVHLLAMNRYNGEAGAHWASSEGPMRSQNRIYRATREFADRCVVKRRT